MTPRKWLRQGSSGLRHEGKLIRLQPHLLRRRSKSPLHWRLADITYELPKVLQLHGQSPAVAEWFAWKLRTLGTSDIKIMAQRGGVVAVLSAMRAHPSLVAVQEDGCGALARFAACDSEVRAEMLRQHCVSEIEAAMRLHRGDPECQEAALCSCSPICRGSALEGAIVSSSSCLHRVAEAMRTHPHRLDLQHSGCSLLS